MAEGTGPLGEPQKGARRGRAHRLPKDEPPDHGGTAEEYPEALLTQDDFNSVRASFRELAKKTPPEQMPRFETSCGRGGVFVFVATDQRSKELLLNKLATLEFGARNSGWQG